MAPSLPPVRRRRRPRRGSLERPVDGRLYRGAFLFLTLPLLLAAFTIRQPVALPAPTLPPTFDVKATAALAANLANEYPDRTPGSAGAAGAVSWFRTELARYGLQTRVAAWEETVTGLGTVRLRNEWAVVRGTSPEVIVIMAHRDNTGVSPGADDNASGTAALVELARPFARTTLPVQGIVESAHTLVFLSTDGGSFGGLGAARFAQVSPFRDRIVAVMNLDAIAGG